jgi:hypothetical protein
MAGREEFYLTLLSDGSICMQSFPNNTLVQFKTLLLYPLNLTDGDWEVALTEMMYSVDLKTSQLKKLISMSSFPMFTEGKPQTLTCTDGIDLPR